MKMVLAMEFQKVALLVLMVQAIHVLLMVQVPLPTLMRVATLQLQLWQVAQT